MKVLIATDGSLDAERTAEFAAGLAGSDGSVTVMTFIEINRNLLRDLRSLFGERVVDTPHQDAEYVSMRPAGNATVGADWPGDDEMLHRYLDDQRAARTGELAAALSERGIEHEVIAREGEAAGGIIAAAGEMDADVVCVGSTGGGLFDGLLGSTSTKVARRCPTPVLIIR